MTSIGKTALRVLVAGLCLALAACTESDPAGEAGLTPRTFTARVEDNSTRLQLEPTGFLFWNTGDRVSVFSSAVNERYAFVGNEGDHIATFSKEDQTVSGGGFGRCYAVYPYNQALQCT